MGKRTVVSPSGSGYDGRRAALEGTSLKELWLHVGDGCNLSCAHCLLGEARDTHTLDGDLATDIVRQGLAAGVTRFYMTGGEPILYPSFFELARRITPEAHLAVLTNGTLIDGSVAARLAALPRLTLQVSLEGADPQTHDAVRGAGAFDGAMAGIRSLLSAGVLPSISTTLTTLNVDGLTDVTRFVGELGLSHQNIIWLHARGRTARDASLLVEPSRMAEAMRLAALRGEECGVTVDNFCQIRGRMAAPAGTKHDLCHCAYEMLCVGPDGQVYPCPALVGDPVFAAGDLRTSPLEEIRAGSRVLAAIRDLSVVKQEGCDRCDIRFLCGGGCLSQTYYQTGRLDGPDPYCDVYRSMIADELVRLAATSTAGDCGPRRCPAGAGGVRMLHCSCTGE